VNPLNHCINIDESTDNVAAMERFTAMILLYEAVFVENEKEGLNH
jgi:hypothetical protein